MFLVCRCNACRRSSHPVFSFSHARVPVVHFADEPAAQGAADFFIWNDNLLCRCSTHLLSSVSPVCFSLKHEMVSKPTSQPQGFVRPSTTVRYHDEKIVRRSGYARCSDTVKRGRSPDWKSTKHCTCAARCSLKTEVLTSRHVSGVLSFRYFTSCSRVWQLVHFLAHVCRDCSGACHSS